jgi:putative two-component system response regulator
MNDKKTILIVDDTAANIDLLKKILGQEFRVKVALSGEQALKVISKNNDIDMLLLDIMMPGMDGYTVCKTLKENPATEHIPVIFVTAMSEELNEEKGLLLGAVDYITKPLKPAITLARIRTHLAMHDHNRLLEQKVRERTVELEESRLEIIRQLGRAAEYKDNETGMHVIRVGHVARLIAESMSGGSTPWTELMFIASPMHDIGKIGIPDRLLLKPGRLEGKEWTMMQTHTEIGGKIIGESSSDLLQLAKEIALTHHERWDGKGYPKGLKGDDIPLSGRIVAVADTFDALTSVRPYKEAWSIEKSVEFIEEESGHFFDPQVVDHFRRVLPKILEVKETFVDDAQAAAPDDVLTAE